ncbi:putative tyrosine-protein kinase C03B1.5 [Orbicella faveolata]|uniref:putative tyrosine-protein kinase C03B1.5 n=1 Tax=Orbicella faveolata TaxID=48498 RepID=UPI0009E3E14E|nr:putative tyrosine-protein kinase C03B1.5 [Orbicella faveolata]
MELCKENLMRHIFLNPKNIPARLPSLAHPTERTTIRWAKDIVNGLEHIHKQGYVHGNLKLENILMSLQDVVKIADVGVSKEGKMITGTMAGTPGFVAPEVIKSSVYDNKADLYSFGIMMWEICLIRQAIVRSPTAFSETQGQYVEAGRSQPGKN